MALSHDARDETRGPELFVDFANGAWRTAPGLGEWLSSAGLGQAHKAASRLAAELPSFVELRGLVRSIARRIDAGRPPTRSQVASLNRILRESPHYHELRSDAGATTFRVAEVGEPFGQARAAIAGSMARFIADGGDERLRLCASDSCRWLFVDRSPGGRRRWCDMKLCGNRDKVRRHRARARQARAISQHRATSAAPALDTLA